MKHKFLISLTYLLISLLGLTMYSCNDEDSETPKKGQPLRMGVSFGSKTRLAELPNPDAMANHPNGLGNIGVYIYYTENYEQGDLSDPYIRNMEFTVNNGELLAASGSGTDQQIYIYDKMTVVAFYPYNPDMSLEENHFTVKSDEEKYPITRNDYQHQTYIPYRAQTNTDPSIAYYTSLTFVPKHTYKVEMVIVADDTGTLPNVGDVQILPERDPVTTPDTIVDGRRKTWYDNVITLPNTDGTGSPVQQYVTYIWTREGNKNEIKMGDILLQSNNLTLIASQDLVPTEDYVYRYGYNMSTGEIFIPTSSRLINTASSISALDGTGGNSYQVCDIRMTGNWTPISLYNARYDGGGHQIANMVINSTSAEVGLFSQVQGNSVVANVHLVNPQITVTSDNAYVGGLVGRLNTPMTEEQRQDLIGNLPPGLSPIVREALIKEILATAGNSQANIVGSKVDDPVINVTGQDPHVGGLVGQAGEKSDQGESKSRIWDTAVNGGTITVNSGNPALNANAYVGGFVGLNQGYIGRSYTTTNNITAQANGTGTGGTPILVDKYTGFTTMGTDFTPADGSVIESNYSQLPDQNNGVTQFANGWPSWSTYTGDWPVDTTGWLSAPGTSFWFSNGTAPDTYPTLQWERR